MEPTTTLPHITKEDVIFQTEGYQVAQLANLIARKTFSSERTKNFKERAYECACELFRLGFRVPDRNYIRPEDWAVLAKCNPSKLSLSKDEKQIIILIQGLEHANQAQVNAIPSLGETKEPDLDRYAACVVNRTLLLGQLHAATDAYIADRAGEAPSAWQYTYKKNMECGEGLSLIANIHREGRISEDEHNRLSAILGNELETTRRFALHKIAESLTNNLN
ncbi:MAG: hypothetical protein LIP02_09200 [Bacteroidales bacterium]|nr:hypothetical protein [Bacteroidales bacterium]